jgi:hypothetical protein
LSTFSWVALFAIALVLFTMFGGWRRRPEY